MVTTNGIIKNLGV